MTIVCVGQLWPDLNSMSFRYCMFAAGSIEDVTDDEDVLGRREWVGLRHRFP